MGLLSCFFWYLSHEACRLSEKDFDHLFLLALQRFIHYQLRRIAFILYHLGTTSGRRGMYDSLRDRKGPLSLPCSRRIWRSVHSRLQKFVAIIFLLLFEGHLTADPETGPSLGLELIEVFLHWRHHGFRVQGFDWSGLVRPWHNHRVPPRFSVPKICAMW